MSWRIEPYLPGRDAAGVLDLWRQNLGEQYPISERVFWQNTIPGGKEGICRCALRRNA